MKHVGLKTLGGMSSLGEFDQENPGLRIAVLGHRKTLETADFPPMGSPRFRYSVSRCTRDVDFGRQVATFNKHLSERQIVQS